ncbi:MAG: hypothetical protein RIK87_05510 [Fuerstiella sp.]
MSDQRKPHNAEDEQPTDRRSADIGLICTHHAEIRPLLKSLDRVRKYTDNEAVFRGGFLDETLRIAVVEAGAGFAQHRRVAETLVREHRPLWVLSVGFSSALTGEPASGDLCLAREICDTHGNSLPVKCTIPESKRVWLRKHVVADSHPRSPAERQSLAEAHDAFAVDTTSLAVAQVCQTPNAEGKAAAKFLSIRALVGRVEDNLSEKVTRYLFEPQPAKARSVLELMKRVKPDSELTPWKKQAEETARHLNRFVLSLVRQLGEKITQARF